MDGESLSTKNRGHGGNEECIWVSLCLYSVLYRANFGSSLRNRVIGCG